MMDTEPPLHEFARRVSEYPIVCVAVYYCSVRELNDDIETFIGRQGHEMIPAAVRGTMDYLEGRASRRMVASEMGIDAVEGIAITQAVERVISVVGDVDPDIAVGEFDVEPTRRDSPLIRLGGHPD